MRELNQSRNVQSLMRDLAATINLNKGMPGGVISTVISKYHHESAQGKQFLEKWNSAKEKWNVADSSLAYLQTIDTLTGIRQDVINQQFYEVPPAEFVPTRVGFNAWGDQVLTYLNFFTGDDFESGIINQAGESRIARTDTAFSALTIPQFLWAKELQYSIAEVEQASRSGNWSLIEAKEVANKTNWDLGIQKIAFLGSTNDPTNIPGLLTLSDVFTDTTTITIPISSMSDTQFMTFIQQFVAVFRANSNYTIWPDTFVISESDWLGLETAVSSTYPNVTKLAWLQESFKRLTGNPNAKVTRLVYCDQNFNTLGFNRYVMYKNARDVLEMNINIDYTSTVVGTANNFQFQSVSFGQFTGVLDTRPLGLYYFDYTS